MSTSATIITITFSIATSHLPRDQFPSPRVTRVNPCHSPRVSGMQFLRLNTTRSLVSLVTTATWVSAAVWAASLEALKPPSPPSFSSGSSMPMSGCNDTR
ncbi:hypothetical protein Vretifemale_4361 [Volvox reticuliferus]|uniref:Uncharacterized protein n=1 Tax=Volvox reticuliferus TaxID=1737510 RepID=A0A8J4C3Z4_9CHLO|nr:hypothetical protein Vretifemale_4361 [Volvox reticuliferus]